MTVVPYPAWAMKAFTIAVLVASLPLGAVVGALLKLDAKARGWSNHSWLLFAAAGAVGTLVFLGSLVVYTGGG